MSLLLIDKPEGPTSHAVVALVKRTLKADKVGHLGTLDPFASGLLPIMIGNTARLSDYAMDGRKGYVFTVGFGRETDTLDPTGRVITEAALPDQNSISSIQTVLQRFTGTIEQVPPVYSALKMNGMPLYEYMRATGKLPADIETKRRSVVIHSLELIEASVEKIILRTVCSKGTYIRSLARDIAKALNSVGTCTQLRRELVEPWHVKDAMPLAADANGKLLPADQALLSGRLLPAWSMVPYMPRARIGEEFEIRLQSGNHLILGLNALHWESENLSAEFLESHESPTPIFLSSGQTLFVCEGSAAEEKGFIRIQPRKRII
jgi:tRNA pseudouridine55 synthase